MSSSGSVNPRLQLIMDMRHPTKLLLIGWDAADWKVIHPLIDAGKMPNMARFVDEGVIGNLASISPELSPMLWTSIATGKRPYKHGILGFTEPDYDAGGIRPITNISRRTKAIWNILSQCARKSIVVGWWPSHPVEAINGVMVSNHYQQASAPYGKPWPMRPGTVFPARLTGNLAQLRLHPQKLDIDLIMHFVPRLHEIDQERDIRIESIAKIIAECTTISRAATAIMHHEPWDFAAVYFDSIDHFCHGFMNYHPPQLPWVDKKDYGLYSNVVESGYIYHDLLLGSLLEKTDEDTVVMIVSDHGFHSDHLRPAHIPSEPAGPFVQHRPYGIFAMKGRGIRKDEMIYGASLLDICPTILAAFGLPVGRDMDGKPLLGVFETAPGLEAVPSWDGIPGNDGMHPAGTRIDAVEAKEAIDRLVELGYIEKPDQNQEKAERECRRELGYNLARSYINAGRYRDAIGILCSLTAEWPDEYRFGIQLIICYQAIENPRKAREILDAITARKAMNARKANEELKTFIEGHKGSETGDWAEEDKIKMRHLKSAAATNPFAVNYLTGTLLFSEGRVKEALRHLKAAEQTEKNSPDLQNRLGEVYHAMGRFDDAERSFLRALRLDFDSAPARLGLARTYLAGRQNRQAAEEALSAIGLLYHNPFAHYVLGIALQRMGRISDAVQAIRIAVAQNPCFPEAHRRLAHIYGKRMNDHGAAERHLSLAAEADAILGKVRAGEIDPLPADKQALARTSLTSAETPDYNCLSGPLSADLSKMIVIVSGLPRSGTSMAMQMLSAGGIPVLTDGMRTEDEDNRKGYFEYEKAKVLRTEKTWLRDAAGKAVKIVAQLLTELPLIDGVEYRVVFMERNLDEVLRSQKIMLARNGKPDTERSDERLGKIFTRQLQFVKRTLVMRKIPTIFIDYNRAVSNPAETAARINNFFGGILNEAEMADAVDPSLYRNR